MKKKTISINEDNHDNEFVDAHITFEVGCKILAEWHELLASEGLVKDSAHSDENGTTYTTITVVNELYNDKETEEEQHEKETI